jgi:hypothetical protein
MPEMEYIGSEKDKLICTGQELSLVSDSRLAQDINEKARTVSTAWSDLQDTIKKRFVLVLQYLTSQRESASAH